MVTPHKIPESLPEIESELARLEREHKLAVEWVNRTLGRLHAHFIKQADDQTYKVLLEAKRQALLAGEKQAA